MVTDIIKIIVSILLICSITCSIMKIIEEQGSEDRAMSLGRTEGDNMCVKDEDGFIVCKEEYSDVNYQHYEKVGTEPLYERPDPQNECFIHGEKVVCRDPPFSPYNKYYPVYAPEEILDYPTKVQPYLHYPYSMIKQSYNWWG